MKQIRDINVNDNKVAIWRNNKNNLTIVEHNKENNKAFKKKMYKDARFSLLTLFAIPALIVVNFYGVDFVSRMSINQLPSDFGKVAFFLLFIVFCAFQMISAFCLMMNGFFESLLLLYRIVKTFQLLSISGRHKSYAMLNKNDDLMCFVRDVYGKNSEQLIAEYIDKFTSEELVVFIEDVKEQLAIHTRIAKIKQLISKSNVDDSILEDLNNKTQELNHRYEELRENIQSFMNLAHGIKKEKIRQSANEEAIKLLAA